ncbi:MAG: hypothetical protein K0Q48_485 [Bacillota bacterium]|jgi:acyl carrier protein|nr:hypothetical protein [Bacillota bacterium]
MEREIILKRILASKSESDFLFQANLQHKLMPREDLSLMIRIFLAKKFLLERIPDETESIYDLAEESLSLLLKKDVSEINELQSGCSGATSAMAKKVLFLMALQRALNIKFAEEAVADIRTVESMTEACYHAILQQNKENGGA